MTIWVDADACPKLVRDILCRAAHQRQIELRFVANQFIAAPASPYIKSLVVAHGFDEADHFITQQATTGDLVITSDIPLAADALAKGADVIDSRGNAFSKETIGARLTMRDFMETLRGTGVAPKDGPPPFSAQDKQHFANALDRWIARTQKI
jgi:uncharacterized protein YaiI (UPF0178 family)